MNLWMDEAVSYFISQESFRYIFINPDFHPPLFYLLLKIWIYIFGDSIIAMRYLSVLIAVLTISFSIKIFELFSRNKWNMSFFVLNLILNTAFLYHSAQIRQYALGLLLVLTAVYLFLIENKWFFIPMTSAIYTHYFTIFAFIPFLFHFKKYWKQFLYSVLLFVPYLPVAVSQIIYRLGSADWYKAITLDTVSANYFNYVAQTEFFHSGFVAGLIVFLTAFYLVLNLWVIWENKKNRLYWMTAFYLIIPAVYIMFCIFIRNVYNPRYFYFLSVFFLIPVFKSKIKIVFILFTVLNLIIAVNFFQEQDYELKIISDYVIENKEANLLVFESPMSMFPVMYYTREENFTYILVPYQPLDVYSGYLIEHFREKNIIEIESNKTIKKINKSVYYFQSSHYLLDGKKVLELKGINLTLKPFSSTSRKAELTQSDLQS